MEKKTAQTISVALLSILLSFFFLYFVDPASAQTVQKAVTYNYCIDNMTLQHIRSVTVNISERQDLSRTLNTTEYENCPTGCVDNECRPPNYWMLLIVLGIVFVIIIIYAIFKPSG